MPDIAPGQRVALEGSAIAVGFEGLELNWLTCELPVALDGTRKVPPTKSASRQRRLGASNLEQIREAGSRTENINFGVNGSKVRIFLASARIAPLIAGADARRSRAEIVQRARGYIYRVMCEG